MGIIGLLFAVIVYRHASGKARYNRVLILIMCLLGFIICLPAAYLGYLHNPDRKNIKFREVL